MRGSRKFILALGAFTLLFQSPISYAFSKKENQESERTSPKVINNAHKSPEFIPNEILIKLKDGKTLDDIKTLNTRFHVKSQERVFQDLSALSEDIRKMKNKLRGMAVANTHDSWYWQLDKDSQEYKDYMAKLEKEKEFLAEEIKKSEERQKITDAAVKTGRLQDIYQLQVKDKKTNIRAMARAYAAHPAVQYAEPNYIVHAKFEPNDLYWNTSSTSGSWAQPYDDLWGLKKIKANLAWDKNKGSGIIVAVIDTGVDYNHEDIQANMWTNPADGSYGYNFIANNSDPMDDHGHGTHCAGIIAAVQNNSVGISGVAPEARIMAVKGLNNLGSGDISTLAKAALRAVHSGADVLNCSWGDLFFVSSTLKNVFQIAQDSGVVVVAPFSSFMPQVISVAATDQNDVRCPFSKSGNSIDIAAPGGSDRNILSLRSGNRGVPTDWYKDGLSIVGSKYYRASGTSMACSYVSGVVAELLSANPGFLNKSTNGHDQVNKVRSILKMSSDNISSLNNPWAYFGQGRLNADEALKITSEPPVGVLQPIDSSLIHQPILGIAKGAGFASYALSYGQGFNPVVWIPLTQSSTAVLDNTSTAAPDDGVLYNDLNLENFTEELYTLKLVVISTNGRSVEFRTSFSGQSMFISPLSYDAIRKGEIKVIRAALGGTYQNYTVEWSGDSPDWRSTGITYPGSRSGQDFTGDIAKWDTSLVPANSVPDYGNFYTIRINMERSGTVFSSYSYNVYLDEKMKAGWPRYIAQTDNGFGDPVVADLDGDGRKEIVVCSSGESDEPEYNPPPSVLFVYNENGSLRWSKTIAGRIYTIPTIGDMDNDGKQEIYISGDNSYAAFDANFDPIPNYKLYGFKDDGTVPAGFPVTLSGSYAGFYAFIMADLKLSTNPKRLIGCTQDPVEVYVSSLDEYIEHSRMVVIKSSGSKENVFELPLSYSSGDRVVLPAVGNFDTDSELEIVVTGGTYIDIYNYNKGTPIAHLDVLNFQAKDPGITDVHIISGSPVVGDVNGDGKDDIVVITDQTYSPGVWVFERGGAVMPGWPALTDQRWWENQSVALGEDPRAGYAGKLVMAVGVNGSYYVLGYQGNTLSGWPQTPDFSSDNYIQMLIGDVDGDGSADVVMTGEDSSLSVTGIRAWRMNGDSIDLNPDPATDLLVAESEIITPPTLTDINSDGKLDLVAMTSDDGKNRLSINVWDLNTPYQANTMQWPMFGHDAMHTGRYVSLVRPTAPSGLAASVISSSQINLAWTSSASTVTGFKVYRSANGTTFLQIGTTAASIKAFNDTGLNPNTLYYYKVQAVSATGDSPDSNTISARTKSSTLIAPSDLTATAFSNSQINLSWKNNSGSTVFKVYRSTDNAIFSLVFTTAAGAISYNNTGLTANSLYYYKVKATNSSGDSSDSNIAFATTLQAIPTAPSNLDAYAIGSFQSRLFWTDNSDNEAGFKIYRSLGSGAYSPVATTGVNVIGYTDTGLTPGSLYHYKIKAVNAAGESAVFSNIFDVTTGPATPSGLTATTVSTTQINLSWTNNSGSTSVFKVYRSPDAVTFSLVATTVAGATTFSDTGLDPDTFYYYKIVAVDTLYQSSLDSSIVSATTTSIVTIPTAPTNLSATAFSSSQINLSWADTSTNETGFKVYRNGTALIPTLAAGTTAFSDTGLTAGTTYSYKVRATNSAGDSADSNTVSAATLQDVPSAPTNLVATAVSGTQINLSWTDASTNETGFKVYRGLSSTTISTTPIATLGIGAAVYQDSTGLTAGTTYYYKVQAYNTAGSSDSNIAFTTTLQGVPSAPTNLVASVVSGAQINLSWTDTSTNETGFKVYRGLSSTTISTTPIATLGIGVTSYSNTSLAEGTTYYYKVQAYNTAGDSADSNIVSATTLQGVPSAPTNLVASAVSGAQINLSWTDTSTNETGFKVYRSSDGTTFLDPPIATTGAGVTTYQNTGLTANTGYYYKVKATDSAGDSAFSGSAFATTLQGVPTAPSNLVAEAKSSTQINLSWTDTSTNETGFEIHRGLSSTSFSLLTTVGAGVQSYSNTGLSAGTTYYYQVRAINTAGNSAFTSVASATTLSQTAVPTAPSSLTATASSDFQINLTWQDNSSNETYFYIYRGLTSTSYTLYGSVGANTTTFSNTNLSASTTYYYWVAAYNANGASNLIGPVSATTLPQAPPNAAPSNLTATPISSSQIDLVWTDNSGNEKGFEIYRGTSATNLALLTTLGTNSKSYRNTGLSANTPYYYQVRAVNAAGNSAFTNVASATTNPVPSTPPTAPSDLVVKAVYSTQITLTWKDNSTNEDSFEIYRGLSSTNLALIGTVGVGVQTYNSTGLSANTTYYYQVRAVNTAGKSAFTNLVSATTK